MAERNALDEMPHLLWRAQAAMGLVLAASAVWFAVTTVHWPLTGDAALMHSVTRMIARGRVPYRDIADINLPGAYLPTWLVGQFFSIGAGASDLAWRGYDLALLAVAGAAMYVVARPKGGFAAVWAGCLFALVHGRDGILQTGQRDLAAAVLLVGAVALLLTARRTGRSWLAAGFGACAGAAACTKPTLALFAALALLDVIGGDRERGRAWRRLGFAAAGWLLPVAAVGVWLWERGALRGFWYRMTVDAPYHAAIGRAPVWFLLRNSLSPLQVLVAAWVVVLAGQWIAGRRMPLAAADPDPERRMLLAAAGFGALSYLLQMRGYQYHRYPFQVFLLLVMGLDFMAAARGRERTRWLAIAAVVWGAMVLVPVSAARTGRYEWRLPARAALEEDLRRAAPGGDVRALDGQVQCLDTTDGCLAALDHMGVVQATGTIYDEFLFHAPGSRAVDDARAGFLREVQAAPPRVFVVGERLFPDGPDGYAKLRQWPEFQVWLDGRYAMVEERAFTTPVRGAGVAVVPPGYRIYIRR